MQPQHQPQVLHRRTRGPLAEIVEAGDQHRLATGLVGMDRSSSLSVSLSASGSSLPSAGRTSAPIASGKTLADHREQVGTRGLSRERVKVQRHRHEDALAEMPDRGHEDRPPGEAASFSFSAICLCSRPSAYSS